ncbi:MAG: hypothetical protein ACI9F2_001173 [Lysobacterales bacterium]|jgi:hypothetical protein
MCILTVFAVVYINMQMNIFDLAYKGKKKEGDIRQLIEQNGNLTYKILSLKSSTNLGVALLDDDSGMGFAKSENVVKISSPIKSASIGAKHSQVAAQLRSNPILNLFSFGTEAEAKGR